MSTYSNVWGALFEDKIEAENLRIRSELMIEVVKYKKANNFTQKKLAELLRVSQPRISDLLNGKIDKFTIDMLVNFVTLLGSSVDVVIQGNIAQGHNPLSDLSKPWLNFRVIKGDKQKKKSPCVREWGRMKF